MSCGVVTITAPATGTRCDKRELDVAGAGRHVDDQVVQLAPLRLASSCVSACVTIGPRQTIGCSASTRKPIDITLTPCACIGCRCLPSGELGRWPARPIISGWLGP